MVESILYSREEVCKILGVSKSVLDELNINEHRVGRRIKYSMQQIQEYLANNVVVKCTDFTKQKIATSGTSKSTFQVSVLDFDEAVSKCKKAKRKR